MVVQKLRHLGKELRAIYKVERRKKVHLGAMQLLARLCNCSNSLSGTSFAVP